MTNVIFNNNRQKYTIKLQTNHRLRLISIRKSRSLSLRVNSLLQRNGMLLMVLPQYKVAGDPLIVERRPMCNRTSAEPLHDTCKRTRSIAFIKPSRIHKILTKITIQRFAVDVPQTPIIQSTMEYDLPQRGLL